MRELAEAYESMARQTEARGDLAGARCHLECGRRIGEQTELQRSAQSLLASMDLEVVGRSSRSDPKFPLCGANEIGGKPKVVHGSTAHGRGEATPRAETSRIARLGRLAAGTVSNARIRS